MPFVVFLAILALVAAFTTPLLLPPILVVVLLILHLAAQSKAPSK